MNNSLVDLSAQFGDPTLATIPGSNINLEQDIIREQVLNASLNQPIFNLALWHTFKQAKQIVSQAESTYMAAEQDLIVRTANAYFNVLKAQDNLEFVLAEKRAIDKQLAQTRTKYNVGVVAITDLKELQAQFDSQEAQEISATNDVENAREQLKIITGSFIEHVDGLHKLPLESPQPSNDNEWVEMADFYNPDLLSAKYQTESLGSQVSVQKDQHLPIVEFNGGYGSARGGTPSDPIGDWERQWQSSVQASINIFSGGQIQSNVRRAQYDYQAALDNYELVRRNTETNVRNSYRNVISAISQVQAFNRAVESSNVALEATTAGYNAGTRTSVDLLASISNLYQQESSLAAAKYNYILAILQLKRSAGTLNSDDVFQVSSWLNTHTTGAKTIIQSVPGASGTQDQSLNQ
jgi:outer membrane protein